MNSSFCCGFLPVQLESLPTSGAFSSLDFSLAMLFALRAASLALAALTALSAIAAESSAFFRSSRIGVSMSITTDSTAVRASVLPSLVFVWPSNCMELIFSESTAVKPSLKSSPDRDASFSFNKPILRQYSFMTFVSAERKPVS